MAKEVLDLQLSEQLASLVEKITTSGQASLDVAMMKDLKKICKKSDEYIKQCFYQCITQLEKDHSEIRLSSFLIIDELFNRSHMFRQLLLQDFQNFMELTLETDPELLLPPPKQAAKTLKGKAMRGIHQWQSKFGEVYKQLSLAYNFLKHCKKIDFESMEAQSEVERMRQIQHRQKLEAQERQRVQTATKEMSDMKTEIRNCLLQAENCLMLLLPEPESFDINGLKSPDPHRCSNPWKDYSGRRKSTDSNKYKKSKQKLKQEVKETTICPNKMDISNVKDETCEKCGKIVKPIADKYLDNDSYCPCVAHEQKDIDKTPLNSQSEKMNNMESLNSSQEGDSDDFQEITDSDSELSDSDFSSVDVKGEHPESYSPSFEVARQHGLGLKQYNLSIEIADDNIYIDETEDNEDIINTLRDSVQLAENKFLPSIQKYLEVFTKAGNQEYILRALDIRGAIENMKSKVGKLKFSKSLKIKQPHRLSIKSEESDGSDDDFEEVADCDEKEGYEPHIPENLREEYGLLDKVQKPSTNPHWNVHDSIAQVADKSDPTTYKATLHRLQNNNWTSTSQQDKVMDTSSSVSSSQARASHSPKPSTSTLTKEEVEFKKKAPCVPFNTDLLHWGKTIEAPMLIRNNPDPHRFWFNKDENDDKVDKSALASLTSRMINFTGKFEPVKHSCRAPLPSGRLCPRMDRIKCPFHGKIIPRDTEGKPISVEDRLRLETEEEKKQQEALPDWEDPLLQQEIQAATGIDVSRKTKARGKKGKGKRQRKFPNLTDIGPKPKTSRGRLESKVLNERTLKRVAASMDSIDSKRHKDKYANQFNYAMRLK